MAIANTENGVKCPSGRCDISRSYLCMQRTWCMPDKHGTPEKDRAVLGAILDADPRYRDTKLMELRYRLTEVGQGLRQAETNVSMWTSRRDEIQQEIERLETFSNEHGVI